MNVSGLFFVLATGRVQGTLRLVDGVLPSLTALCDAMTGHSGLLVESVENIGIHYAETLKRGFAVVRGDGAVMTTKAGAEKATALEIEFSDGRLALGPRPARKGKSDGESGQGSLF